MAVGASWQDVALETIDAENIFGKERMTDEKKVPIDHRIRPGFTALLARDKVAGEEGGS
ncbi:MAG: hypothetical protein JXR96_30070 [Deltaproteobacteria bacterium]|nr:hypothetical protein [Deltaproteobacteria bacterium]